MSDTGYDIEVVVTKVEKIAVPKGHKPRWRLHTSEGIFLTSPEPNIQTKLTSKNIGPYLLTIRGERVTNWKKLV